MTSYIIIKLVLAATAFITVQQQNIEISTNALQTNFRVYPFDVALDEYDEPDSVSPIKLIKDSEIKSYLNDIEMPNERNYIHPITAKRSQRTNAHRLGCIKRNGACDHRPHDCCYNSSCRCNLWGSNCRCQRMGLFQKWG